MKNKQTNKRAKNVANTKNKTTKTKGDVGLGESYVKRQWSTNNLSDFLRLILINYENVLQYTKYFEWFSIPFWQQIYNRYAVGHSQKEDLVITFLYFFFFCFCFWTEFFFFFFLLFFCFGVGCRGTNGVCISVQKKKHTHTHTKILKK